MIPLVVIFGIIVVGIIAFTIAGILKDKAKREQKELREQLAYERAEIIRDKKFLSEILKSKLGSWTDDFIKKYPQPFQIGDEVILNIYDNEASNRWDGGAGGILGIACSEKKYFGVIQANITEIKVSTSLTEELIDTFAEHYSHFEGKMNKFRGNQGLIPLHFNLFMIERGHHNLGLYWDVHFDLNFDFKPNWGVNAKSWLLLSSPEGQMTKGLWERKINIESERMKLEEAIETFKKH